MSEGARCRFSRIPGQTPKGVLDSSLTLPAVIGNLELEEEAQHTDYTTLSAGQFSERAQGGTVARMLRAINVEGLTLDWSAAWLVEQGLTAEAVKGALAQVLRSKKPVEMLLMVGTDPTVEPMVRMNVTFRGLKWTLRTQENDTRYLNLTIKEWRDASVERKGTVEGRKPGVKFPATHALNKTDTLQSLAHEFYGTYSLWRDIRDANGISKKFGQKTPLVKLDRYKTGSIIKLPKIKAK